MTYVLKILLITACYLSSASYSFAEPYKISLSSSMPPYSSTNEGGGIAADIMNLCLIQDDKTPILTYTPNNIITENLKKKEADVAFPLLGDKGDLFVSDPVLDFHNIAVSLRVSNFKIKKISDLEGLKIGVFKNAQYSLGDQFKKLVETGKPEKYIEFIKQNEQIKSLLTFQTDVIILDKDIFTYHFIHRPELLKDFNYVAHPIFPVTPRYAGFIDEELRNDFNICLREIKENGVYKEIYRKHTTYK